MQLHNLSTHLSRIDHGRCSCPASGPELTLALSLSLSCRRVICRYLILDELACVRTAAISQIRGQALLSAAGEKVFLLEALLGADFKKSQKLRLISVTFITQRA